VGTAGRHLRRGRASVSVSASAAPLAFDRLRAVAVLNARATVRPLGDTAALVSVPVSYPRWLSPLAWALRLRRARTYELEGVGLALFQRVDGAREVIDHVDWLAREHKLSFQEAKLMTMKYLESLMARSLVVIVARSPSASA
jgi:hypothetical protein